MQSKFTRSSCANCILLTILRTLWKREQALSSAMGIYHKPRQSFKRCSGGKVLETFFIENWTAIYHGHSDRHSLRLLSGPIHMGSTHRRCNNGAENNPGTAALPVYPVYPRRFAVQNGTVSQMQIEGTVGHILIWKPQTERKWWSHGRLNNFSWRVK